MSRSSRRGESLVELIVALVLLEVAGALALAAALSTERVSRHASLGSAEDQRRWEAYRAAELAPACVTAVTPAAVPLTLPATADRPALVTTLRCGP